MSVSLAAILQSWETRAVQLGIAVCATCLWRSDPQGMVATIIRKLLVVALVLLGILVGIGKIVAPFRNALTATPRPVRCSWDEIDEQKCDFAR